MTVKDVIEKVDTVRNKIDWEQKQEEPDDELIDILWDYVDMLTSMKVSK